MKELLTRYTCPSCWTQFEPEKTHWIATSDELLGDDRLGEYEHKRFLPRHFTPDYSAVDEHGGHCNKLACPHCHLEIPIGYFEAVPFFTSIVGGTASGKSFFIVSMVRWLKRDLPTYGLSCAGEPARAMNQMINERIHTYFMPRHSEEIVHVLEGDKIGSNSVPVHVPRKNMPDKIDEYEYSLPLMYSMLKTDVPLSHYLCIYDHAGGDYVPGVDDPKKPLTKHVGSSDALFFLVDPTQNVAFIKKYKPNYSKNDLVGAEKIADGTPELQVLKDPLIVFTEMTRRIRVNYRNKQNRSLALTDKYDRPLIIVVTKCDAWQHLLPQQTQDTLKSDPIGMGEGMRALSTKTIKDVSDDVHRLILQYFPELINMIDRFGTDITYIPVSATGMQPTLDDSGRAGFIAGELKPIWIGVPFLCALAKHELKLVDMK